MIIIECAVMPNETRIELEDWSYKNTPEYPDLYGLCIVAYPIAKNTGKYRWVESVQTFRLTISMNQYTGYTNEDVKADFEALKNGEKSLDDLAAHFFLEQRERYVVSGNGC